MAATGSKSDLTIIKIYWEGKTYQIYAEEVKEEDKQENEKYFTSDSHDAKYISFGKCEYSIDLSGILPDHKKFFNWIRERQRSGVFKSMPTMATYEYVEGKVTKMSSYKQVYVEDISRTGSEPFDVKLGALQKVYRDAKNKLI